MAVNQLSTVNIGLLDPKTVFLKDYISGRCYFPSENEFKTESMEDHTYTLIVEGTPPPPQPTPSMLPLTVSATDAGPSCSSTQKSGFGAPKMYNNCSTKVMRADKKLTPAGKIEFECYESTYVELKPSTANVNYIESRIQAKWGEDYIIVGNDGLRICDSSATRGIKFWRVGARKIFAINDTKRKRPLPREFEDNYKRPCLDPDMILDKLQSIGEKIETLLEVNANLALPLGVSTVLLDSLRCNICKVSPIRAPPIFVRCCRRILGCQDCVDQWYGGDEGLQKKCPLCRADRGYADTSKMLGLDELLKTVANLHHVPPAPVAE